MLLRPEGAASSQLRSILRVLGAWMNPTNGRRVLLISNSTLYGRSYLDHAEAEIRDFLGIMKSVLFVPFALYDRDAYAASAQQRFQKMGYGLESFTRPRMLNNP